MTLATVVENVANEAGYSVETNVITSTETTTKQLRTMAQRLIKEMSETYPWPVLYAAGSITLVSGQSTYALPAAFSYYHYNTFWNQSKRWRVLGPMTPQEYADIIGYGLTTTVYDRFQFRGVTNNQFFITPTPGSSGDVIIFEYIADRPIRPRIWTASTLYAANTYTFYNGNYYFTTAGGTTGVTPPTHTSGSISDGGVTWDYYDGAYNEFLANTDVAILNEKTLELGILERFAEIHGLTVTPGRYDMQLNEDFSKQNPGKILYAGGLPSRIAYARDGVVTFGTFI